jgi:hypothetical protein
MRSTRTSPSHARAELKDAGTKATDAALKHSAGPGLIAEPEEFERQRQGGVGRRAGLGKAKALRPARRDLAGHGLPQRAEETAGDTLAQARGVVPRILPLHVASQGRPD